MHYMFVAVSSPSCPVPRCPPLQCYGSIAMYAHTCRDVSQRRRRMSLPYSTTAPSLPLDPLSKTKTREVMDTDTPMEAMMQLVTTPIPTPTHMEGTVTPTAMDIHTVDTMKLSLSKLRAVLLLYQFLKMVSPLYSEWSSTKDGEGPSPGLRLLV